MHDTVGYRVRCGETIEEISHRLPAFGIVVDSATLRAINGLGADDQPGMCALLQLTPPPSTPSSPALPTTWSGDDNDPPVEDTPAPVSTPQTPPLQPPVYGPDNPYQGDDNSPDLDPTFDVYRTPPPSTSPPAPVSQPTPQLMPEVRVINDNEDCGCI